MRTTILAGLLALTALAPLAVSTPAACADDCVIESHSLGYRPPAMEIQSGATVTWTSIDTVHVHVEQATVSSEASCFDVISNTSQDADPVQFTINGTILEATTNPGTAGAVTATCNHATPLEGGAWLMPYVCVLHPALMKGALVVTP